ncbi:MAG: glycine--tRNA ligase subunit beta [Nitrospirota bacterium]
MTDSPRNHSSLLLEIGTEDLPARFVPPAIKQIKENIGVFLTENHIRFSDIRSYGTPRRLAVIVDGVPPMQEDRTREVFGPSTKAAFDSRGNPTKAAVGFANSQGVSVGSLAVKNKDKGEYVVAVIEEQGVHVKEVLPEILKRTVLSIHLPKSMRWGSGTVRFARPVRWLLALFDNEVINFEIDGIRSDNMTKGHRFLSPAAFKLKEAAGYSRLLGNNFVIVDPEDRKKMIIERTGKLLEPLGEKIVEDEELLETVMNLVEYPSPVLGEFSETYLTLPKELLITVMKGHQKYFAVEDGDGRLTNHFVIISNTGEDNADTVKVGAEKVIRARFEDARFYYEEDTKKQLIERLEELKKVTFQESLGSLYDKTLRIVSNSGFLAERLMLADADREKIRSAALLAKADLVTGVVREFPELQGIMGKYYALHDGRSDDIATAVEEHYLPTYSGGRLPQTDIGAVLSLADKTDNIAAFFCVGLIPSGSEDPFALRRAALGIIAILLDKGYDVAIGDLVEKALSNLPDAKNAQETKESIRKFFEGRIETVLSDQGYGADLVDSVLSLSLVVRLGELRYRLDALRAFRQDAAYNDFLTAIKRICNIIPKKSLPEMNPGLLTEEHEKKLKDSLDSLKPALAKHMEQNSFREALVLLTSLTEPVNQFFDHVLVMDKREEVKQNRLSLLTEIWNTVSAVADFSKLPAA